MRYWDSSALMPLVVQEASTAAMRSLLEADGDVVTWWASRVEAASALARLEREAALEARALRAALTRLEALAETWAEVAPTDVVPPVTLDRRLGEAALREGFPVLGEEGGAGGRRR